MKEPARIALDLASLANQRAYDVLVGCNIIAAGLAAEAVLTGDWDEYNLAVAACKDADDVFSLMVGMYNDNLSVWKLRKDYR